MIWVIAYLTFLVLVCVGCVIWAWFELKYTKSPITPKIADCPPWKEVAQ